MTRPGPTRPRDNRPAARPAQKPAVRKRPTVAPIAWFRNPQLKAPSPIVVDPDGRFRGHGALWGSRHLGIAGSVPPPHDRHQYAQYHRGALDVLGDDGKRTSIAVGLVTMNADHADLAVSAAAAADHYANTARIAGYARAGEDAHGVWVAGQIDPDLDDLNLRRFRACGLSGDWRSLTSDGRPDALVGFLAVPTAGFPVPRGRPGSQALVAAGALPTHRQALVASAARKTAEATELRARAGRTREAAELFRELEWSLARTPEAVMRYQGGAVADHAKAITAAARLDLEAHQADVAALADELAALLL